MSQQVWISDEAYAYVKSIQAKLYADQGVKEPMGRLISKAVLCNVEESK